MQAVADMPVGSVGAQDAWEKASAEWAEAEEMLDRQQHQAQPQQAQQQAQQQQPSLLKRPAAGAPPPPPPPKPSRRQRRSKSSGAPGCKEASLPPRLAVLKWCFYELLVARQPIELLEVQTGRCRPAAWFRCDLGVTLPAARSAPPLHSGARVPVTFETIEHRVKARLVAQQLPSGEANLSKFCLLAAIAPRLMQLRWFARDATDSTDAGPDQLVLDLVITAGVGRRGQTAPARLRAVEKELHAIATAATKAVALAAKPGETGGLAVAAAIEAALPEPVSIPAKPVCRAEGPRWRPEGTNGRQFGGSKQSTGGHTENDSDGESGGGASRLLSPAEVSALPGLGPRSAAIVDFLVAQPFYRGEPAVPHRQLFNCGTRCEGSGWSVLLK